MPTCPRTRRTRALPTVLAVLAVLAAGCGDGDSADDDSGKGKDSADDTSGSAAGCATDVVAGFPDGEVELGHTAALDVGGPAAPGGAYTLYAADYEVTATDALSNATGDQDHLATLAITTFNADGTPESVAEGSTVEWTDEFGVLTFSVVLNDGATAMGNTSGASGTVEVVSLDDEQICVEVDYSDDEKSLTGTIAADLDSFGVG